MVRPTYRSAPLTFLLLLLAGIFPAQADPNVLLFGATLSSARALAMESALQRGWTLVADDSAAITFEQVLEEDAWGETPTRVIRVHTRFAEESGGVRVVLSADELESPGTGEQWIYDVTDRYAENLGNALSSLRAKWDTAHPGGSQGTGPVRHRPAPLQPPGPHNATTTSQGRVGTWAYYAERYAQSRGCELNEQGAVLEAAGESWEHHRVGCLDGSEMRIRCRYGDCTSAP